MPRWLKVVLMVGGLLFLSCFAMCGACAYLSYDLGQEVNKLAPQAIAEAERDALDSDQAGCLEKSLQRGADCDELGPLEAGRCMAVTQIYAKACFEEAKATEGFCDDLPEGGSLAGMVKWPVQRCIDLGREGSQSCVQIVQSVISCCGITIGGSAARPQNKDAAPIKITPPPPPPEQTGESTTPPKTKP